MNYIEAIIQTVEEGKPKYTERLTKEALEQGLEAVSILHEAFVPAMEKMGLRYKADEIYIAKILSAARCVKYGLRVLKPFLEASNDPSLNRGKVILGTALGDLHDVGKNLVALLFESAGFEVIDLGIDVSEKRFVQAVKDHPDAVVVCVSALLTTSMGEMKHIVKTLNQLKERDRFKIMVGGGPITKEFAQEIGADAYTDNAYDAAEVAKTYVL